MKAALEIWGARGNLFHQGFAKQTDDADIVKATMAKPGVILRRAVGTKAHSTRIPTCQGFRCCRKPSSTHSGVLSQFEFSAEP